MNSQYQRWVNLFNVGLIAKLCIKMKNGKHRSSMRERLSNSPSKFRFYFISLLLKNNKSIIKKWTIEVISLIVAPLIGVGLANFCFVLEQSKPDTPLVSIILLTSDTHRTFLVKPIQFIFLRFKFNPKLFFPDRFRRN